MHLHDVYKMSSTNIWLKYNLRVLCRKWSQNNIPGVSHEVNWRQAGSNLQGSRHQTVIVSWWHQIVRLVFLEVIILFISVIKQNFVIALVTGRPNSKVLYLLLLLEQKKRHLTFFLSCLEILWRFVSERFKPKLCDDFDDSVESPRLTCIWDVRWRGRCCCC